jgi:HD-GYP domain-containing protein (c-di-GMP phosphodiesterase class II)
LHLAASIHDLGKISIPIELLIKPRKLTAIEFAMIKEHPVTGFNIIKNVKFPWPIAKIIQQHHERIDGSGYPFGLKGNEILLESKILAVADAVEAMASHRPYRAALGLESALAEITRQRGIAYDADVVDACLRIFHEQGYKFAPI